MKSADKALKLVPPGDRRDRENLAFLPAALEIVETPPSPIGRGIALAIALVFSLAIAWASWSRVDVVASARGKIVPVGRTKVLQPFETGVVRAIYVQDGQRVRAGDPLIDLDPQINEAERAHLQSDLVAAELDTARIQAALAAGPDLLADFKPPADANASLVDMQRNFLISETEEHRSKIAALEDQLRQKQAEIASAEAGAAKLEAVIPIEQQILDMRKTLADKGYGSRLLYLENLQSLVEAQNDLAIQERRIVELRAALSNISDTLVEAQSEYRHGLFTDLDESRRKVAGLKDDLAQIAHKIELQRLTSPVDGVVQQLAVHTIGGVVTPAEPLLVVVPTQDHLEIEASLSNRDVGFVHAGQTAKIKVDTFDFTRYGLLQGRVMSVSKDAIARDDQDDASKGNDLPPSPDTAQSSGSPQGQGLSYSAWVSLDKTRMRVDDNLVSLLPGMAVTIEIETGSRSVMSYLLSPLLRYGHDSLRER